MTVAEPESAASDLGSATGQPGSRQIRERSSFGDNDMHRLSNAPNEGPVRSPILPWLEMGAYEALFLAGMTFEKVADLFKRYPGGRPSEFVPSDCAEYCADAAGQKMKDAGVDKFGLRINHTENYPVCLRDARNPVELLYYQGVWELNQMPGLSVIGSRNPTIEGMRKAAELAKEIVYEGFAVVSGLASGIDRAAHLAATENGGATIAVIGTPLGKYYPKENRMLQKSIAKKHLLISQVPILKYSTQHPSCRYQYFRERSATMSALTLGTIIVEAADESETLHQARAALFQKRKLFILDRCFKDPNISWPKFYESVGAIRVRDSSDIWSNIDV